MADVQTEFNWFQCVITELKICIYLSNLFLQKSKWAKYACSVLSHL